VLCYSLTSGNPTIAFHMLQGSFVSPMPADFSPRGRGGSTHKTGKTAQFCYRMPLYLCEVPLAAQGMARLTEHLGCPRALLRAGVHRCCSGSPCQYGLEDAGYQGITPRGACL